MRAENELFLVSGSDHLAFVWMFEIDVNFIVGGGSRLDFRVGIKLICLLCGWSKSILIQGRDRN